MYPQRSNGNLPPQPSELAPLERIFVTSANIIDLHAMPHGSELGTVFDAAWTDDSKNLEFLLSSRTAQVNGQCLLYNLYVSEQLKGGNHFERFRYDESLKDIEIFDGSDRDVTNNRSYYDRVAQLTDYLESAPMGNEDVDGTFEVIMAFNDVHDPRMTKRLRRFARRAIRGFKA